MNNVGTLILFAIAGAYICAKSRAAGGAVAFALIAVLLFLGTPAGAWVPEVASAFFNAIDRASSPALTDPGGDGAG